MAEKIKQYLTKNRVIFILVILSIVLFFIIYQIDSHKNSALDDGVEVLVSLESRDLYTLEEKIDYMKRKAVDANDYSALFGSSVIFGDSIAEGLGLYGFLSATSLVAVMGESTENSVNNIQKLIDLAPHHVFFELGLNDISHPYTTLDSYISSYENLIDLVQLKLPNARIYICSIFPVTDEVLQDDPAFNQIESYNVALEEMAARKHVTYINTYDVLKRNPEYHNQDGIHVLPEFYPLWLDTLVNNSDLKNLL